MDTTNNEAVLASLQDRLGIRFDRPELLRQALTHSSYVNEQPEAFAADNERLEFLGDAVLGLLVGEALFHRYPGAHEGALTSMRAAIVRTDSLARAAHCIHLGDHLFLGRGEEASGGRTRVAILAAAFEAVIGATYLDHGLAETRRLVLDLLGDAIQALDASVTRDPKSLLQERIQARMHYTPVYRTVAERGPDHAKEFVVEVLVAGQVAGTGVGPNKQAAEQAAAQAALKHFALAAGDPPPPEDGRPQEPSE